MDRLWSSRSTVAAWVRCSLLCTSMSSGLTLRGTPGPSRSTELNSVRCRSRSKLSPNSYRFVSPVRSPPSPDRKVWWPPRRSLLIWEKTSFSACCPSLLIPLGVSSSRSPRRRRCPASSSCRKTRLQRLHLSAGVLPQAVLDLVQVYVLYIAAQHDLPELRLQLVHLLQVAHQLHGLVQGDRLVAHEGVLRRHVLQGEHAVHLVG